MALKPTDTSVDQDPGRDPMLDRAYALGEREEPPARLDDAIRAAARREVGARPSLPGKTRRAWHVPVALAAVLVLSVTLVTLMREEGADQFYESAPSPMPQAATAERAQPDVLRSEPVPAAERAAVPETDVKRERAAKEARDDLPRQVESILSRTQPSRTPSAASVEDRQAAAPPAPAASPGLSQESAAVSKEANRGPAATGMMSDRAAPFVTSPPAKSVAPGDPASRAEEAQPKAATPLAKPIAAPRLQERSAPTPAESGTGGLAARAPVWAGLERQAPEKWIERIEELRRAGREPEAREVLEEFKRRFPEHPLPAALAR
jgi:hypothetical protein